MKLIERVGKMLSVYCLYGNYSEDKSQCYSILPDTIDWSDLNGNTHRHRHIAMMAKIKLISFNSSASKKKRAISRSKNKNCPKNPGLRF